jgi:arabinose-5-phosphate isomerase
MIYGLTKMENEINKIGLEVIDLQIKALKKLKNSIDDSFKLAVEVISKCKSKVLVCGVGKSGKIASKIASTLSSIGVASFSINPNDCSHGDLGGIEKKDIIIMISYSGNTDELKSIIKYVKFHKIVLIGIVSNKNSILYKSSKIKLLIPEVVEAGYGIVPTSSTTVQLAIGDALSIALMKKKGFTKLDFKKYHPSGNLGKKLKTISEIMLTNQKIPFVNENETMKNALKTLTSKKLGFIVLVDKNFLNTGIFTDGDLKRLLQKKKRLNNVKIKHYMTKKPYSIDKQSLVTDVLTQMNKRKITNACVYEKNKKNKIIGVVHIHHILESLK